MPRYAPIIGDNWPLVAGYGFVFVKDKNDFPDAVNGVITLEANATYYIQGTIDLEGSRIVCAANNVIRGSSSENCLIKSTGLTGSPLITSAYSLPIKDISFTAETVCALDANGNSNQAIDWNAVNFVDCGSCGTIANYNNVILLNCAMLNSGGFTFDGSIGTVGIDGTLFDTADGTTAVTIPATATITRRFRIIYSAFVTLSGETGINVNASATVPVEGYILDTVNFAGGGTYTTGVAYDDNKALFVNNRGVDNSAEVGIMYMLGNATATTISGTSTPVKVAGTTTFDSTNSQKFSHTSNRLTYSGALSRTFYVSSVSTFTSSANNEVGTYIAKNGTTIDSSEMYATANAAGRVENVTTQTVIELAQNDYIEIWVENATAANNITVEDMNVVVRGA